MLNPLSDAQLLNARRAFAADARRADDNAFHASRRNRINEEAAWMREADRLWDLARACGDEIRARRKARGL